MKPALPLLFLEVLVSRVHCRDPTEGSDTTVTLGTTTSATLRPSFRRLATAGGSAQSETMSLAISDATVHICPDTGVSV